jgi:hypothetical protein
MNNQIDELMALADDYADWAEAKGKGHPTYAESPRQALQAAIEAALKPGEPTLWARYPRYTGQHQAVEVTLNEPDGNDWVAFCEVTTPPAQTPPKGLFVDLIALHPGLAEELKAIDEAPMPTWTPPPRLTEEAVLFFQRNHCVFPGTTRAIETAVRRQFGVHEE